MHYELKFEDGIKYISPDIRSNDPGWATESGAKQKGITKLSVKILKDRVLILQDFEKYNFFVEASQPFNSGKARIEKFYFLGASKGYVAVWSIDFTTKQITKRVTIEGEEYNGTPTKGWRKGVLQGRARSGICHLK